MEIDLKKGYEHVLAAMVKRSLKGAQEPMKIVVRAVELDCAYMDKAKVHEGMPYNDEAAFVFISKGLKKSFPALKNASEVTDDYMEAWERYLESEGLIEWD